MIVSRSILTVCLFVCLLQATYGDGHGSLRFVCKPGWTLYEGDCYLMLDTPMTRDHASATCKRQGGYLFILRNQQQFFNLKDGLPATFWTGIHRDADGNWIAGDNMVSLQNISLWANYEPDESKGSCVFMDRIKGAGIQSCDMMDYFVCQYEACLEGFVPCALGGKCINASAAICDGVDDCVDKSDERNCSGTCKNFTQISADETSGEFSSGIYEGIDCWWSFEAPVGKRIRLSVPHLHLELNCGYLHILTGSPSVAESREIEWLTGHVGDHDVYSDNNFLHVRLYARDLSPILSPQTFSWTTDIPNIMGEEQILQASSDYQSLMFPFSSESLGPEMLSLYWRITVPEGEVISYHIISVSGKSMVDAPVYIKDGDMDTYHSRMTDTYYTSAMNNLIVRMQYSNTISDYVLYYQSGCNITISGMKGQIHSPGDTLSTIPHELTCEWTMDAGQSQSRGMSVKFPRISLATDPRQPPVEKTTQDVLQVYLDDNTSPEAPVVFADNVTNIIHAPGGKIKVRFESDVTQHSHAFEIIFGIDCEPLSLSDETIISPATDTFYGEEVTLSCPTGYQFNLEKYKDEASVTLMCETSGFMIRSDVVIPQCQVQRCGTPPKINNGFIIDATTTRYEGKARYGCNQGFTMDGSPNITCSSAGRWTTPPTCTSSECSVANDELTVENGGYKVEAGNEISGDFAEFSVVVKFFCNDGYELIGQLRTYCNTTSWDHAAPPTCRKLKCLLPEVVNAEPFESPTIEFDTSTQIQCKPGYEGSQTVTCLSNQTLDMEVTCTDINECNGTNDCDNATTTCMNTEGNYTCECLDGYRRVDDFSCTDILECANNSSGCDFTCVELPGSYKCQCDVGYDLFTEDGLHGYMIPDSENGLLVGDLYRINHTCVRKLCPPLVDVPYGQYLARNLEFFHFMDRVTLRCDDGYYIPGFGSELVEAEILCTSDGTWNNTLNCTARSCEIPIEPEYGMFDKTSATFGDTVTLTCNYSSDEQVMRKAMCIFDGGSMRLGGENINECPVIDCREPVLPDGGDYNGTAPSSTRFLDSPSFLFKCRPGYDQSGGSGTSIDSDLVVCQDNGRWNFGTLRCDGKKCTDPGTPVDAMQIVETYEIGKNLTYSCTRDGFKPLMGGMEKNYTCVYNDTTDTAQWTYDLGPDNLPVCTDTTHPEVVSCPEDKEYFPMQIVEVTMPTFSDNFGINVNSRSNYMETGDVIIDEQVFDYTVRDFENLMTTCSFTYRILDRDDKPLLTCPSTVNVEIMGEDNGTQEVKELLINYDSNATLDTDPTTFERTFSKIGSAQIARVTLTDGYQRQSECTFMIHFTAGTCFQELLIEDSNADRTCASTDDGLTCNSTCKNNSVYDDGTKMKTFTCSGTNNTWVYPMDLDIYCLPIQNPAFLSDVNLEYDLSLPAQSCRVDFDSAIHQELAQFEANIADLSDCDNVNWNITVSSPASSAGLFKLDITLQLNLLSTESSTTEREACINQIQLNSSEVFNIASEISCDSDSTGVVLSALDLNPPSLSCRSPSYSLRRDTDDGDVCVPCGPGYFYDATIDNCTRCPSGEYQDEIDQGQCKSCPAGTAPNADRIACDNTCPPGFSSSSGFHPCEPCPVDQVWVDSATCEPCPGSSRTIGLKGADSSTDCYEPCRAGSYSETGYDVDGCTECPDGFYQPAEGMASCLECSSNETTDGTPKTEETDCTALDSCSSFGCDVNGTDQCEYHFHRPVCKCKPGFHGSKCEMQYEICNYDPCTEGSTCNQGVNNTDFTCTCRKDLDDCDVLVKSTGLESDGSVVAYRAIPMTNQTECKDSCLADVECRSALFTEQGNFCFLFNIIDLPLQNATFEAVYMEKNCTSTIGGTRCEKDLVDDCETSDCSPESMCMDKVNGYECLCPTDGGYSGPLCTQAIDVCDPNPCRNGTCMAFGTVRHQCTCWEGYTGNTCDTLIDECMLNPGVCLYNGTCTPEVGDYNCECTEGFSGDNCENTPDFCSSNECLGNVCYSSLEYRDGVCTCESPLFENVDPFTCNKSSNPCDFLECKNGGTCSDSDDGLTASCSCMTGFTGHACQHNIDDCFDGACSGRGTCNDEVNGYNCTCDAGFEGENCENNTNDCPGTCANGTCVDGIDTFTCNCVEGFTGASCEIDIDECVSCPCQHGGNCTQGLASYTCDCPVGWTGSNCEMAIDICAENNQCQNDGRCFSILEKSICRCEGGTQGEFCENPADICEILADADLCQNDGMCQNADGSAVCLCQSEYSVDRCYFMEGIKDTNGGADTFFNFSSSNSSDYCKEECLKLENCAAVAYFQEYCFFYEMKDISPKSEEGSILFNRVCPIDYSGDSCQFIKDHCADADTCKNNGQCSAISPIGFMCDCQEGYSGTVCENVADPCGSHPCGDVAACWSTVTDYICQCPQGQVFTGSTCEAPENSFGLLVNTLNGEETTCLVTPFRLESNTFSLMMWVKFYAVNMDAVALHLFSGSGVMPMADEANFDLKVTKEGIIAKHKDNTITGLQYNSLFGNNLFDGEWHHVGIAVDTTGDLSSTIDARASQNSANIGSDVVFSDNVQICLGSGVFAEYKNISVWDYYLTSGDFSLAKVNMFTAEKSPVQGWWNYLLQPSTVKLSSDLQMSPAPDMTRLPPVLDCRSLVSPIEEVIGSLSGSFVSLTSVTDVQDNLMTIADNNPGLMFRHTLPNELSWGHHEGIVIGVNEYNNYDQCRFPVYVKYNEKCPIPREQGGADDVQLRICDSGDGVCSLSCSNADEEGISAPLPRYMTCSKLGVYDTQHPFDHLILPACNLKVSPKYVITASMQFEFRISCAALGSSLPSDVEQVIRDTFKALQNDSWTDICNSGCLNLEFLTTQCSENANTPNRFDLKFELHLDNDFLTYVEGGEVNAEDAMRMIIKLDEDLSLGNFGEGVLLADTVTVMQSEVCTTDGYALIWEGSSRVCVPCGPGRYYVGTRMDNDCVLCPRGMYQDDFAQMMCKPCGNGTDGNPRTTYQMGAVSEAECVEVCSPGKYYNEDANACMDCPRHYYQDEEGQNFCKACDIGYKTISSGSNSSSDCKEDCLAGQERDAVTEECVNCTRGYWRSLDLDNCRACPIGRTTMIGEFGISEESCSMDNCPPGRYWNTSVGECVDCEFGTYQSENAMLMCDKCQKNYTTRTEGSISAENCTFYCATGYEVDESRVETCMPCERGKYKDNMGSTRFDMCQSCDEGKTTDFIAAVSSDNCSVPVCKQGEVIVNGSCEECEKDTFSEVELPFTTTTCEPCSDLCDVCGNLYGTNKTGAVSQSECILFCPAGFELIDGNCLECERGFFKDNSNDESRFGMCEACSPDGSRTTDDIGATHLANCTVPVCKAGQFVDGEECKDCEENSYQEMEVPFTSTTCFDCQPVGDVITGTRFAGSNSSSDCLPICEGGKEFDSNTDTCTDCPMGTYKPASRKFDGCLPCNENYTTNGTGALEEAECNIRNCQPGTFINETTDDCQVCPIGQYQDEPRKTSCKECGENLSTEKEGSSSSDACQVFCNPGLQGQTVPGTDQKVCEKCPEHFFKSEPGLAVCEECPPNFTSDENRTSCPDLFCYFGYQYNSSGDGSCEMCAEGFFKALKGNDDSCLPCEAGYTTNGTGQSSCSLRFCVPGEFFNDTDGDCSPCEKGSYKPDAGNQECTPCPVNKTTQATGTTMESECDLSICPIGQYRNILEKNCTVCPLNTFQNKTGQTSCIDCPMGFITLSPESTGMDDCVPECQRGEQYEASNKTCIPCPAGTYKDTVGNEADACTACPTDRTTVGTGSVSDANCTEILCARGFYADVSSGSVVCIPCAVGQYSSERGQRSCSLCDPTRTTLDIGSDSLDDCVEKCIAGYGYDVLMGSCQPCPRGSFNDLTGDEPNVCKVCPDTFTNLVSGSSNCNIPDDTQTSTTGFATLTTILVYNVVIDGCGTDFINIGIQIQITVRNHFISLSQDDFSNSQNILCADADCTNIDVVINVESCVPVGKRRRRRAVHTVKAIATFTNVSDTLIDRQDRRYSVEDVLSRILTTDTADLTPLQGSIEYNNFTTPVKVPVCFPGENLVNGACQPCAVGFYESQGLCFRCPADTYQNQTGQSSCIDCPENEFVDTQGSVSANACQTSCEVDLLYCNNRGTCIVTGRRTARCDCFDNYKGVQCDIKDEPESNMPVILGVSIGASGGLLFIILIAVGLYRYLSISDKKKKNRLYQDFQDPSPENDFKIYDNYSMTGGSNMPRPNVPYPSIGYPALGYRPDASYDDFGTYNAYKKHHSANDEDQDVFVWQT